MNFKSRKMHFKIILVIICLYLPAMNIYSQQQNDSVKTAKNIIKLNFFALGLKNISIQYERSIAKKISFAAGFRWMPEGDIPLKSTFIDLADDAELERQLDNLSTGNIAFTPEIRFYCGRKKDCRGFYIAPYARLARYTADLLYEYDDAGIPETIPLSGSVNTLTGGLLFGAQWRLGKKIYLDWWILGPNYGKSDGTIEGKKSLSDSEQQSLREDLEELDIPLTEITYTVNANGATVNFNGPWAGMRAGLCLGIRF